MSRVPPTTTRWASCSVPSRDGWSSRSRGRWEQCRWASLTRRGSTVNAWTPSTRPRSGRRGGGRWTPPWSRRPRRGTALADASASLAGARALLGESWRYGGRLSAVTAKAAAGRAHRGVSDVALQVCGAIGLTAEHDLHRYVTRGFQVDALCGSHDHLEALLAERLFEDYEEDWAPGRALPAVVTW